MFFCRELPTLHQNCLPNHLGYGNSRALRAVGLCKKYWLN
ncbi:hypothetical protein ERO13_A11G319250v2 [Gossypium hirsutum]|nr:hypothetical protein ERO13_A11G319250v2 [Gossypium hirsutum]